MFYYMQGFPAYQQKDGRFGSADLLSAPMYPISFYYYCIAMLLISSVDEYMILQRASVRNKIPQKAII